MSTLDRSSPGEPDSVPSADDGKFDQLKKLLLSLVTAANNEQQQAQLLRVKNWFDHRYLALEEAGSDQLYKQKQAEKEFKDELATNGGKLKNYLWSLTSHSAALKITQL